MGRLIGLELHNFKSYRGTASIGFGSSNFTCIIGPNGAGKSNMMDAVSFLLGIRSSHLRSAQLKDLIYRGRIMQKSNKEAAIAQDIDGETQFKDIDDRNDKLNPSSAYVMGIYEKSDGEILRLKRTITSLGNSEYKINDKTVSASEYSAVLKSENILIKAKNFLVFQGDVEQIASQSPMDLTKLIETVSGSVEYAKDYDSLKDKLEDLHERSNAIFQKKRMLNSEFKRYKEQKVESDKFEKKSKENQKLILFSKLAQLYHFENQKNELIDKLELFNNDLKKSETSVKKNESSLKTLNSEFSDQSLKILNIKDKLDSENEILKNLNKDLIPLTTKKDLALKKIANFERRIKEISFDVENQDSNICQLLKQKDTVSNALKNFDDINKAKSYNFNLSKEGLKKYQSLKQQYLASGGSVYDDQLNMLNNNKITLNLKIENLSKQRENYENRISILNDELITFQNQQQDFKVKLADHNDNLKIKKNYINEVRIRKEQLIFKENEINKQIKDVLIKLSELSAAQRESNRERKLRENLANLQRLFPGVKGLVSELCKPKQKKYELAISTILGKNFDSIVVDNINVAQKCITYLKEQRAGVASFIPMNSVEFRPIDSSMRHILSDVKPAIDVIDYDPVFDRVMQHVCGNTLVCENIKTAKYIRWEKKINVKVVTLDGSLIHKAGFMTGGISKNDIGDGKSRWDKSMSTKLMKQKDQLLNDLKMVQLEKPSEVAEKQVLNELIELENTFPLLENTGKEIQRSLDDVKSEIIYQQELLNSLTDDLKSKELTLEKINTDLKQIKQEMKSLKEKVYDEFINQYNINLEKYEEATGQLAREIEAERVKFVKQLSTISSRIEFESERLEGSKNRLEKIKDDQEICNKELMMIKRERSDLQNEMSKVEAFIQVSTDKVVSSEAKLKEKKAAITSMEDQVSDSKIQLEKIFKKCSSVEEEIEKEMMRKIDVIRNCKIENIEIPLIEGLLDDIPIGENPDNLIELSEDLIIDYTILPTKYRNTKIDSALSEITHKIKSVSDELSVLVPNAKALERMKEVEKRLNEVDDTHEKTREEESVIVEQFNEVKEKRYDTFIKAFDFIANQIDSTYKDLTKSSASPLGGSAYLTLEDEEEPFNAGIKYHAMPPLKRFRDMELLSGGEKTVAALALLFAIHSYQPSPFFVLDEVDAALDNANVQKVANYIVQHSGPDFQFIVISLKNGLFEKSEALVGIYREQVENSSKTLTLDLRNYNQS